MKDGPTKDTFFMGVLVATGAILLAGLVLTFASLLSPFVFIFGAIMLLLCLGPIAEIRGIY